MKFNISHREEKIFNFNSLLFSQEGSRTVHYVVFGLWIAWVRGRNNCLITKINNLLKYRIKSSSIHNVNFKNIINNLTLTNNYNKNLNQLKNYFHFNLYFLCRKWMPGRNYEYKSIRSSHTGNPHSDCPN